MLDSHALEKSYKLLAKTQPDYIEVLPGVVHQLITEVKDRLGIPLFAGGFIRVLKMWKMRWLPVLKQSRDQKQRFGSTLLTSTIVGKIKESIKPVDSVFNYQYTSKYKLSS